MPDLFGIVFKIEDASAGSPPVAQPGSAARAQQASNQADRSTGDRRESPAKPTGSADAATREAKSTPSGGREQVARSQPGRADRAQRSDPNQPPPLPAGRRPAAQSDDGKPPEANRASKPDQPETPTARRRGHEERMRRSAAAARARSGEAERGRRERERTTTRGRAARAFDAARRFVERSRFVRRAVDLVKRGRAVSQTVGNFVRGAAARGADRAAAGTAARTIATTAGRAAATQVVARGATAAGTAAAGTAIAGSALIPVVGTAVAAIAGMALVVKAITGELARLKGVVGEYSGAFTAAQASREAQQTRFNIESARRLGPTMAESERNATRFERILDKVWTKNRDKVIEAVQSRVNVVEDRLLDVAEKLLGIQQEVRKVHTIGPRDITARDPDITVEYQGKVYGTDGSGEVPAGRPKFNQPIPQLTLID